MPSPDGRRPVAAAALAGAAVAGALLAQQAALERLDPPAPSGLGHTLPEAVPYPHRRPKLPTLHWGR